MVLITEMLEIWIQTSYDQNVQLILKSYLPVVYGTPLNNVIHKDRGIYNTCTVIWLKSVNFSRMLIITES